LKYKQCKGEEGRYTWCTWCTIVICVVLVIGMYIIILEITETALKLSRNDKKDTHNNFMKKRLYFKILLKYERIFENCIRLA
jgi:hypothetical protein